MDLLFSSLPSHGHLYPVLPLAIAAREKGHRVTFATAAAFHPTLTRLGLDVLDVGVSIPEAFQQVSARMGAPTDPKAARGQDPEARMRLSRAVFTDFLVRRFHQGLLAHLSGGPRPDLVVWEAAAFGAGLAAKAAGVPQVCHSFGRAPDPEDDTSMGAAFRDSFATTVVDLMGPDSGSDVQDVLETTPYLDIYPPSIQLPSFVGRANRVPLRPVAFAEPGDLPDWVVAHERPLVYLTLGTAFGHAGVLRTAIEGLAATGARVLVAAGPTIDPAELGDPPPSVTVRAWVPQADLLPHVDLVVHHGGSGTSLGAAAAGVPQLFLPQGADQFVNADAVCSSGAGRQLTGEQVTAATITETARALLSDEGVAAAVKALAEDIAALPAPADVVDRLTAFAKS
ncbi:glycosyltransferase [Actinokineospora pegani]|uniref:glycosyltransferase n=1 Tax=Actinokineospora pegani TaxID=2654637 RepID=UPI0012EAAA06|nr:glycosyltransferase [Actinokineospora pegani]